MDYKSLSAMRNRTDFVRMSNRLSVGYVKNTAGYASKTADKIPKNR
ncbi:MAG: hypothetical protein SPI30_02280 [Prevotella sp.]|nr:hypothetical protein [Prevotella sp.]